MTRGLLSDIENDSRPVTFLVGANGSGKSRTLSNLTVDALDLGKRVIAISSTPFDRFPRTRRSGYSRLSPSIGKRYAVEVFKRALLNNQEETIRNASLIGKTLQYTGFSPVLGLHIRIKRNTEYESLKRVLPEHLSDHEVSKVIRALEIYKNYNSGRQSAWIDLYGSEIGPDRREIFPLLKHEPKLRKLGLIESIAITIEKSGSSFDLEQASSGELMLISTHAYIATHIQEGDVLLIDEPENSLHPKWQRDYCRHILDQFHYFSPKLVIATHSPHIVQGAQHSESDVRLLKLPKIEEAPAALTNSIEATLFEAFGVLPPANHYLSEKVAHILNELAQKRATLSQAQKELYDLLELSDDEKQRAFLNRSIELSNQIISILEEKRRPT